MRWSALVAVVLACGLAAAENLLANPGFDSVDLRGNPENWDLFVMPMEGAHGKIVPDARSDPYAARLHNPEAYPNEPANNWSQTIIADLEDATLRVSGHIKTEDATEAAIWLQCWSRTPPRVIEAFSTSTETPVYGTQNWTEASMIVDVPEGTDFIVYRCVLKGRGTAWFDDAALEVVEPEAAEGEGVVPRPETEAPRDADRDELLEANAAMREALASLRETNESMLAQITMLQEELRAVRQELSARRLASPTVPGRIAPTAEPQPTTPGRVEPPAEPPPAAQAESAPPEAPQYGHPLVPMDHEDAPRQP